MTITQRVLASEQLAIVDKIIRYRPAAATGEQSHTLEVPPEQFFPGVEISTVSVASKTPET